MATVTEPLVGFPTPVPPAVRSTMQPERNADRATIARTGRSPRGRVSRKLRMGSLGPGEGEGLQVDLVDFFHRSGSRRQIEDIPPKGLQLPLQLGELVLGDPQGHGA